MFKSGHELLLVGTKHRRLSDLGSGRKQARQSGLPINTIGTLANNVNTLLHMGVLEARAECWGCNLRSAYHVPANVQWD